jgi:hypothetical protein
MGSGRLKLRRVVRAAILGLGLAPLPGVSDGGHSPARTPVYDATGDWVLHVSAPRLLSGDCPVTDDQGYDEQVRIQQDGASFVISAGDGMLERGAIDGVTYTHEGQQSGADVTGVSFLVQSRSTFELTSPVAATGKTLLTIRFEDGTRCLLDLEFSGEREDSGSRASPQATRSS